MYLQERKGRRIVFLRALTIMAMISFANAQLHSLLRENRCKYLCGMIHQIVTLLIFYLKTIILSCRSSNNEAKSFGNIFADHIVAPQE